MSGSSAARVNACICGGPWPCTRQMPVVQHRPVTASSGAAGVRAQEPQCIYCESRDVNWWKSWNEAGEWVCDGCRPDNPEDDEVDW